MIELKRLLSVLLLSIQLQRYNLLKIPVQYLNKIKEQSALNFVSKLETFQLRVPSSISNDNSVSSTFIKLKCDVKSNDPMSLSNFNLFDVMSSKNSLPIVLLHGFDSSCLEYRRLAPLLTSKSDVYIPDILGWGFNDLSNVKSFDPEAKLDHLKAFLDQIVKKPCVLVGASLGGGIAMLIAERYPELVKKLVLIDAQGFIDGTSKSDLPVPLARLGVNVLKSSALRMYANLISYYDTATFATVDAMRIGALHCFTDEWEEASIAFLKSGGFVFSPSISKIKQETLVIWGSNDGILDKSYAFKFQELLSKSKVFIIDKCGHVPHLEKPIDVSDLIKEFISSK